jgi:hypothetical protein
VPGLGACGKWHVFATPAPAGGGKPAGGLGACAAAHGRAGYHAQM